MKKILIISVSLIFLIIIILIAAALFVSFHTVRPTVKEINKDLANSFSAKIVRIPAQIPPPAQDFDQTVYSWEMETLEKEVIGIKFRFFPAFSKNQNIVQASLEMMDEKGDPSLFVKVLPALIIDKQSLQSAQDPQKANLKENKEAGYKSLNLETTEKTSQTTKMIWEFEKEKLDSNLPNLYGKLNKYPQPLLRIFYEIPNTVIGFFRS